MKIVHICLNSLVIDGWGYQDNYLSRAHAKLGNDVTVITSHWILDENGNYAVDKRDCYINEDGVKIIRLKMIGKEDYSRKIRHFEGLNSAIASENPDFIFIHSVNFADITTVVNYLKRHKHVRACADNHADFSNTARNWLSKYVLHRIIWRYYAQKLVPYVERFYGVMPSRVDFLKNVYGIPDDKIELLVMGADDELVSRACDQQKQAEMRNKLGVTSKDILIMTGGKIDIEKRQTVTLMRVVNRFANPHVRLIVFGSIAEELKDQVLEQCSEYSEYIGWVDNKETLDYFAAADLVVFPGRHSVFWEQVVGLGKPMVCKYWDGTTHIDLGGNVKFLYNDTEEELEKCLKEIIINPNELTRMKDIAVKKGMKEFSYNEIAKKSLHAIS